MSAPIFLFSLSLFFSRRIELPTDFFLLFCYVDKTPKLQVRSGKYVEKRNCYQTVKTTTVECVFKGRLEFPLHIYFVRIHQS